MTAVAVTSVDVSARPLLSNARNAREQAERTLHDARHEPGTVLSLGLERCFRSRAVVGIGFSPRPNLVSPLNVELPSLGLESEVRRA